MAKVSYKLPDEFLDNLTKAQQQIDDIIPQVLESGGEVVLNQVQSNLARVISSKSSGQLLSALGISPVLQDREGTWNIKVGFNESRRDGKSNAMIANILEYGKHNQPARPFLKPAKRQSRKKCIDTMKAKLESELNK